MVQLTSADDAMLGGRDGAAAAMAMRIVLGTARMLGAADLTDIASAHIDGCLYHGDSGTALRRASRRRRRSGPGSRDAECRGARPPPCRPRQASGPSGGDGAPHDARLCRTRMPPDLDLLALSGRPPPRLSARTSPGARAMPWRSATPCWAREPTATGTSSTSAPPSRAGHPGPGFTFRRTGSPRSSSTPEPCRHACATATSSTRSSGRGSAAPSEPRLRPSRGCPASAKTA